jgi:hypothetical protein
VGLFLGYPLDDVLGFIRHEGHGYKLCGVWKVYGDPERAKKQFRQYELCRECMKSWFKGRIFSSGDAAVTSQSATIPVFVTATLMR